MKRSTQIPEIATNEPYDLVIVGGGIHGLTLAQAAAASGIRTLLLEKADYASGTSSRSSKMAHGGLRYLELFDFQQVFEGIKAREKLFADFPYLVKPHHFAVPVLKNDWWFRLKLGIGLYLYDFMARRKEHKHSWVSSASLKDTGFAGSALALDGCYLYTDGIMQDARLVIERLLGAVEQGAHCLNYASVSEIQQDGNRVRVHWDDIRGKQSYTSLASVVVNCAGPWAPFLNGETQVSTSYPVCYSRGIHLLFDHPWEGPALFLPMEGKARYYFVWPHPAGTMVGTTESPTTEVETDPYPTRAEVDEVLRRIEKDLPGGNLNKQSLHYAFAGIRTLPLRLGSSRKTGQISRKHIWEQSDRILTLYGGKFTTAEWTAIEGLKRVAALLGIQPVTGNSLSPKIDHEAIAKWKIQARTAGLTELHTERLLSRYGHRVRSVFPSNTAFEKVTESLTIGELNFALEHEQAQSVEDIMRRRIIYEYLPGAGLAELPLIEAAIENWNRQHPEEHIANADSYRLTINRTLELLSHL